MKIVYIIAVLSLLILTACTGPRVVCNDPYIRVGTECCLDYNTNAVCDNDESMIPAVSEIESVGAAVEVLSTESEPSEEDEDETESITEKEDTSELSNLIITNAYWSTMYPKVDQEIELNIEFENQGHKDIESFEYVVKIYKGEKVAKEDTYEHDEKLESGVDVKIDEIEYSFDEEGDYTAKIFPKENEDNAKTLSFYVTEEEADDDEEEEETDDEEDSSVTECSDTDGGSDSTKTGFCEGPNGKFTDYCADDTLLFEYYCDQLKGNCQIRPMACVCEEGRCIG
ncbi:hypothetical protein KY328_03300 [Candidatus Woesearchaeota archaeon]|nr:hypothetical protein [Candidatus Woesearchaeota archaeon]MBW3021920.1 hypothetical protein [Candidatus Woesearchaeota archaeon]